MAVGISLSESVSPVTQNDVATRAESAPLSMPGDRLYEVVDGRIVEKNVGARETEIAGNFDQLLGAFVRTNRLGRVIPEMLYRIDQARDLQRRPDVSFVSVARWPLRRMVPSDAVWDLVPDLAIEIVSPNNTAYQVEDRRIEYIQAGVHRVWIVYPRHRIVYDFTSITQVRILTTDQEIDGGELLPGLRLPLAAIFGDSPEAE
jgi:Uma2 family endonuclease